MGPNHKFLARHREKENELLLIVNTFPTIIIDKVKNINRDTYSGNKRFFKRKGSFFGNHCLLKNRERKRMEEKNSGDKNAIKML